jgi:hypothetical protein
MKIWSEYWTDIRTNDMMLRRPIQLYCLDDHIIMRTWMASCNMTKHKASPTSLVTNINSSQSLRHVEYRRGCTISSLYLLLSLANSNFAWLSLLTNPQDIIQNPHRPMPNSQPHRWMTRKLQIWRETRLENKVYPEERRMETQWTCQSNRQKPYPTQTPLNDTVFATQKLHVEPLTSVVSQLYAHIQSIQRPIWS